MKSRRSFNSNDEHIYLTMVYTVLVCILLVLNCSRKCYSTGSVGNLVKYIIGRYVGVYECVNLYVSTFSNIVFSETIGPIEAKLH